MAGGVVDGMAVGTLGGSWGCVSVGAVPVSVGVFRRLAVLGGV
jgi:hypothetical protein